MDKTVTDAINAVRDQIHQQCKDMGPDQYRQVLEELMADIEGHLEALDEEGEA